VLVPRPKLKKLVFDFDFSELGIKGRQSIGNQLTRFMIRRVKLKDEGKSTLGGIKYWYDQEVLRIVTEEKGRYLGEFHNGDTILCVMKSGYYRVVKPDLQLHFDEDVAFIEKYNPLRIFTVLYVNADKEWYVKRFQVEQGPGERIVEFIDEGDKVEWISVDYRPQILLTYDAKKMKKPKDPETINLAEFVGLKGYKAKGKRLTTLPLKKYLVGEPLPADDEIVRTMLGLPELPAGSDTNTPEGDEGPDGQITLTL
jgi:topoisomerase-4 subunit A